MAFLRAFAATGDRRHLDGAIEAAHALTATQLQSGGWYYSMEFDLEERKAWCYRHAIPEHWPRRYVELSKPFYVTNDHVMRDMIRTFLLAHRLYGREEGLAAAYRGVPPRCPDARWPGGLGADLQRCDAAAR